MFRLLIDRLGGGHEDLFLKIDVMPVYVAVGDSYFVGDFLEINDTEYEKSGFKDDDWVSFKAIKLIDYWVKRIRSLEKGQEKFIPLDLADQGVSGFTIERVKLGFNVSVASTQHLAGYGVTESTLDQQIKNRAIVFNNTQKREWFIGRDAFFAGLEWSKTEIMR